MKIAYISTFNSEDRHAFSGSGYSVPRFLEINGATLVRVNSLKGKYRWDDLILCHLYRKIFNQSYLIDKTTSYLKSLSREAEKSLAQIKVDAVICPINEPLAYLNVQAPKYLWSDHTFEDHLNHYPEYMDLCKLTIKNAYKMQRKVIQECRAVFYTSERAAKSAIEYYHADPKKVHVVPLGSNLDGEFSEEDAITRLESEFWKECRLIMVSSHWDRKGCEFGIKVCEILKSRGIPSKLKIVGARPPSHIIIPDCVSILGYIQRYTQEGMRMSIDLYREAFFQLLPSKEEDSPTVVCEASMLGLPTLGSNVGGVSTLLREEFNGHLLERSASANDYADVIENYWCDHNKYKALCMRSFREYQERLNWNVNVQKVLQVMKKDILVS